MPFLKVINGPGNGTVNQLKKAKFSIGRAEQCDLTIPTKNASRIHCVIMVKESMCAVMDNGSSNGTRLNGVPLTSKEAIPLSAGDIISIGACLMVYLTTNPELPKSQIPGYTIHECIGETPLTMVWRAFQEKFTRDVRLETLKPEIVANKGLLGKFIQEIKAAGKMMHPHILQIHDFGKTKEGIYFFSMELVEATSALSQVKRAQSPEYANRICKIGTQTAEALEYAHAAGIIHKSFEPRKIFINENGDAKIYGLGLPTTGPQERKAIGAEIFFQSPEIALGRPVDGRCDLYSLGAIMYFLLCGKPPRMAPPVEIKTWLANESPAQTIAQEASFVSGDVTRIVDKLISKAPEERYKTGKEVCQLLGNVSATAPQRPKIKSANASSSAIASGVASATVSDDDVVKPSGFSQKWQDFQKHLPPPNIQAAILAGMLVIACALTFLFWPEEEKIVVKRIDIVALLTPIKRMVNDGDLEKARDECDSLLLKYSDKPRVRSAISDFRGELEEKIKIVKKKNLANKALSDYRKKTLNNLSDYWAAKKGLDKILNDHPILADYNLERDRERLSRIAATVVDKLIEEAQVESAKNDFDKSYEIISTFRSENKGMPGMGAIDAPLAEIEAEETKLHDEINEVIKKLISDKRLKNALDKCDTSQERINSTKIIDLCNTFKTQIETTITELAESGKEAAKSYCLNFEFEKARDELEDRKSPLRDTKYYEGLSRQLKFIRKLETLHSNTITRISTVERKEATKEILAIPDVANAAKLAKRTVKISGADELSLKLSIGPVGVPIKWKKLKGKMMYDLYIMYTPPDATEDLATAKIYEKLSK